MITSLGEANINEMKESLNKLLPFGYRAESDDNISILSTSRGGDLEVMSLDLQSAATMILILKLKGAEDWE